MTQRTPAGEERQGRRNRAFNDIRRHCMQWVRMHKPELYEEIKNTVYREYGIEDDTRTRPNREWENG